MTRTGEQVSEPLDEVHSRFCGEGEGYAEVEVRRLSQKD